MDKYTTDNIKNIKKQKDIIKAIKNFNNILNKDIKTIDSTLTSFKNEDILNLAKQLNLKDIDNNEKIIEQICEHNDISVRFIGYNLINYQKVEKDLKISTEKYKNNQQINLLDLLINFIKYITENIEMMKKDIKGFENITLENYIKKIELLRENLINYKNTIQNSELEQIILFKNNLIILKNYLNKLAQLTDGLIKYNNELDLIVKTL